MNDNQSLSTMSAVQLWRQFDALILDSGGELTEDQEKQLIALEDYIVKKAEGAYHVIQRLAAEAQFYGDESKRLSTFAKTCKNASERLQSRILEAVKIHGPLTGETVEFATKMNPFSLLITDEQKLPKKYYEEVVVREVNKALLKADLVGGAKIEGASVSRKESLKIGRPKK